MLSLDNFSDLWNVLFTTVHDGDLCQNFQGVIFFVLVHEDVWRLLDKLDHDDCHNGQRYQHQVQKERHPVDFEKVDDSQGCSRETPSINKKSTMQSSQWPLLLVWKSRYKSPKAKCKKGWQSHRHQNLHIIGTRTAREWLWADLLERRLRSYKKKSTGNSDHSDSQGNDCWNSSSFGVWNEVHDNQTGEGPYGEDRLNDVSGPFQVAVQSEFCGDSELVNWIKSKLPSKQSFLAQASFS